MRKPYILVLLTLWITCLFGKIGLSVPVIGQTWDYSGAQWKAISPDSSSSPVTPPLGSGNNVTLTLTGGGSWPDARIYTTGANYKGDFTSIPGSLNNLVVNFTLNSVNVPPSQYDGLAFYFKSTNEDIWYAYANPVQSLGAQNYSIYLGDNNAWVPGFGITELSSPWNDFASVSEIGFEILGNNSGNSDQNYEFSNIYFSVPEPETVWVIMMVLASLMITFRVRIGEMISQVKSRFVA